MVEKIFEALVPKTTPTSIDNPANLHVIAVYFNFNRFHKPLANYLQFREHMQSLGITLHEVELVVGKHSPFQITDHHNPHHLQLRTDSEFFQKENLINLGIKNAIKLYPDAEYFAWIDTDLTFFNSNIAVETMYKLNRYEVVQMWARAVDLDPNGHPLTFPTPDKREVVRSFAYCFNHGIKFSHAYGGCEWHTGYAWAMKRSTWEKLGGLYEKTIIGASDYHMAWAFINQPAFGIHGAASEAYKRDALEWCSNASKIVNCDLGYCNGLIHHHWHGRKTNRKYVERWSVIVDNEFDPNQDLRTDDHGLLHLTNRNPKLRLDIRQYMIQRNDDDNTVS
jgi:hypothetical protein